MTITLDATSGRKRWGSTALQTGAVILGTVGPLALLKMPTGRFFAGARGALRSLDQRRVQKHLGVSPVQQAA